MLTKPIWGYAFMPNNNEGYPILAMHLGTGDSLANYHEISKEEYDEIISKLEAESEVDRLVHGA